jgi:magnesium chelatase subunit D
VPSPEGTARLVASLLAVNPSALNGVALRGTRGDCEEWIRYFSALIPTAPVKRLSANIPEERLLGGLDFASTISRGHAVYERGVLALADGGIVVLSAGITQKPTWRHVVRALDAGHVAIERDGFSEHHATTFVAVAMQNEDDESCSAAFVERVAFIVELTDNIRWDAPTNGAREIIALAVARLPRVRCSESMIVALCQGAMKLGVTSLHATLQAVCVARSCAALNGRIEVSEEDIVQAATLVFAPRACSPDESPDAQNDMNEASPASDAAQPAPVAENEPTTSPEVPRDDDGDNIDAPEDGVLADIVVEAVRAALPVGLLTSAAARAAGKSASAGRAGEDRTAGNRGRQVGTRKGDPRGGARLDIVATLRAAVPWQRLRRSLRETGKSSIVELRRDDFRIRRCVSPATTTTLFVVDASGSSALNRLAEVKGAIELMLAEGYARRDRVALIAFRGTMAQLLLPPTHALARARRAIAGMPAGGGTPIASALDLSAQVVQTLKRDGGQTIVVILSDGQANVARDGKGGRARADADALESAQRLRFVHDRIVWIDSSARPYPQSKILAEAMGARYMALPMANATGLSDVARMAQA